MPDAVRLVVVDNDEWGGGGGGWGVFCFILDGDGWIASPPSFIKLPTHLQERPRGVGVHVALPQDLLRHKGEPAPGSRCWCCCWWC